MKSPARMDLDELDVKVIALLQRDGRYSLTDMASSLGVSHATIRNRLERLVSKGAVDIRAFVHPEAVGFPTEVVMGLRVNLAAVSTLAEKLAKLSEVTFVAIVTGRCDILIGCAVESDKHLLTFISNTLSKYPEITETETSHVLSFVKRRGHWEIPKGLIAELQRS